MSLRLLGCLLLGLALGGCSDDDDEPCRERLAVGDRYLVSIGRTVPTTPVLSCPSDFDLASGTELTTTVSALEVEAGQCSSGRIQIASFNGWTWSPDPTRRSPEGGADLIGHYLAEKEDCTGRIDFRVMVGGKSCERGWTPDEASSGCAPACYDLFDCEVEEAR